jgi:hypothetical protein
MDTFSEFAVSKAIPSALIHAISCAVAPLRNVTLPDTQKIVVALGADPEAPAWVVGTLESAQERATATESLRRKSTKASAKALATGKSASPSEDEIDDDLEAELEAEAEAETEAEAKTSKVLKKGSTSLRAKSSKAALRTSHLAKSSHAAAKTVGGATRAAAAKGSTAAVRLLPRQAAPLLSKRASAFNGTFGNITDATSKDKAERETKPKVRLRRVVLYLHGF